MDKRLIYRVVLKFLFFVAFAILAVVLVRSLFTASDKIESAQKIEVPIVTLDLSGMAKGDVRKIRWQGKEIGVLKRKGHHVLRHTKYVAKIPHQSLNSALRSLTKEYFIYYNRGDSGNCPLFKETDGFKDICTSTRFDTTGREKEKGLQGQRLKIPPHRIEGDKLLIGAWGQE